MLGLLLLLQLPTQLPDTLAPRSVARVAAVPDSAQLGAPQVLIPTAQGAAAVWLLRTADSAYIVVSIHDSTPSAADEFVVSFDTDGERRDSPDHADFQWAFRRVLDSSIVFRGRNGRWQPPRDDPDWRLGASRAGGGWTITSASDARGWQLVLRLDRAWLDGPGGSRPAIAFRVDDDRSHGSYSWPAPPVGMRALMVEQHPALWVPVGR